jgi:hypothetical protein
VQPNPGKTVLTRNQVFVERLMLMPKNDYAESRH